ncbi:aldo/keto reductase [Microbacterium enclense]|uniref:aldo/keto reductase n=1 Tax=Microbacterium enclense TaxID=993073 RepID=UPI0021A82B04|nr:aldo/keto reductase [Microbacterium enclense]MCT2085671.1 aldo/keto reductase [Microbacterium enclense]
MTGTIAVLGTMNFGDGLDNAAATLVLNEALDSGIHYIDTANGYAGGASEEIIGRALTARRHDVHLASKVGMPHGDADGAPPLSAAAIRQCLKGSFRRLNTDYLDLYYLHQPDRATPVDETLDTLAALLEEGAIRSWAISNHASWQLAELADKARERGIPGPAASQQLYNVVCRRIESEYLEAAAHFEAPVVAYNPLAGGLLTGKHSYAARPDSGRFGGERLGKMYTDRYWDPRMFEAIERLRDISDEAGLDMREVSLRWLVDRPGVSGILVGGSRPEQVRSNLDTITHGPLEPELVERVDAVGEWLDGPVPKYNR